ncbi:MAG TPA: septum formation initiator family protein [Stellaceae bacterium]|nr:septum formation initiator family protein [Stellaceae bacterium]
MRELRRRGRGVIGPVLGMALTGYFAYNLVEGDRGFIAWTRLTQQISAENASLAALRAERAALRLKVSSLSPGHIDPDLLDERVRATLNLVAPNELVMMRPSANAADPSQSSPGDGPASPPNP